MLLVGLIIGVLVTLVIVCILEIDGECIKDSIFMMIDEILNFFTCLPYSIRCYAFCIKKGINPFNTRLTELKELSNKDKEKFLTIAPPKARLGLENALFPRGRKEETEEMKNFSNRG